MTNKKSAKKKTKNRTKSRSRSTKSVARSSKTKKKKQPRKKVTKPRVKSAKRQSAKKSIKPKKKSKNPAKRRLTPKSKSTKKKTKKSNRKKIVKKSTAKRKTVKGRNRRRKSRRKPQSKKGSRAIKKQKSTSRKKIRKTKNKKRPVKKTRKKSSRSAKTKSKKGKKPSRKRGATRKKGATKKRSKKSKAVSRFYSTSGTPLEQLFESPTRVQVMKLFFRNPEESFLIHEATKMMRANLSKIRKEIGRLERIGLLRSRRISPRKQLFYLNESFDFFKELKELILRASPVPKDKILKATKGLGKIKLILLSGIFTGSNRSRADLLIVGDNINSRKLNTFIKNLEAEAGTEINCAVMNVEEFNYRYDMYDRFVRDLLEEKCEFLMNRLGV